MTTIAGIPDDLSAKPGERPTRVSTACPRATTGNTQVQLAAVRSQPGSAAVARAARIRGVRLSIGAAFLDLLPDPVRFPCGKRKAAPFQHRLGARGDGPAKRFR